MSHRKTVEDALVCFAEPSRRAAYFDLYSADVVLHGYGGVERASTVLSDTTPESGPSFQTPVSMQKK